MQGEEKKTTEYTERRRKDTEKELVACNNCFASTSGSKEDISRECENAVPRGCARLRTLLAKPRSGETLLAQCVSAGFEQPSPAALKGRKSAASFAPSALDRIFTATQRSRTGLEESRRFAAFGLLTATHPQPRGTRCRAPRPTPRALPKSLLQATSSFSGSFRLLSVCSVVFLFSFPCISCAHFNALLFLLLFSSFLCNGIDRRLHFTLPAFRWLRQCPHGQCRIAIAPKVSKTTAINRSDTMATLWNLLRSPCIK
jgi:hypothetical protein